MPSSRSEPSSGRVWPTEMLSIYTADLGGFDLILTVETGRAPVDEFKKGDVDCIAALSSRTKTSTDAVRLLGSFSSVCTTACSSAGEISIPRSANFGGGSEMCFFMIAGIEDPLNGTSPASI